MLFRNRVVLVSASPGEDRLRGGWSLSGERPCFLILLVVFSKYGLHFKYNFAFVDYFFVARYVRVPRAGERRAALVPRGRIGAAASDPPPAASRVPRPLSFLGLEETGARVLAPACWDSFFRTWDFCFMESAVGCVVHGDETV